VGKWTFLMLLLVAVSANAQRLEYEDSGYSGTVTMIINEDGPGFVVGMTWDERETQIGDDLIRTFAMRFYSERAR